MGKLYLKDNQQLMKEYLYSKNENYDLSKITIKSNKKVWWICNKGHEWEASVNHRASGRNCPYCSNHRLLIGYNDLATIKPSLINEWNYEKNDNLKPTDIFPYSNKKVWWICDKGHEWEDTPNHRVSRDNGCPYCSNHRLLKGYNDLSTTNPKLAKEWNYEKNGSLTPQDVMGGTQKKVWWLCNKGHEWEATVASRNYGIGCPTCKKELQTSFPEQAIFYYFKKIFPDTINRYADNNQEIDIFIPSIKIGIEYDGLRFHNQKKQKKEMAKDEYFNTQGIKIIRVKEKKKTKIFFKDNIIYYQPSSQNKELNNVIELLISKMFKDLKRIEPMVDISIERDNNDILELLLSTEKDNSILTNEKLIKEWNYEKNKNINPEFIPKTSGKKVWWLCNKGHEWEAIVNSRNRGNGCPYCSNQKLLKGYNDLSTTNPKLAKEWNYEKNGSLTPQDVMGGSGKKVWWLCSNCKYEWQTRVVDRNKQQSKCPICKN